MQEPHPPSQWLSVTDEMAMIRTRLANERTLPPLNRAALFCLLVLSMVHLFGSLFHDMICILSFFCEMILQWLCAAETTAENEFVSILSSLLKAPSAKILQGGRLNSMHGQVTTSFGFL